MNSQGFPGFSATERSESDERAPRKTGALLPNLRNAPYGEKRLHNLLP
jgi:hypothetical protein